MSPPDRFIGVGVGRGRKQRGHLRVRVRLRFGWFVEGREAFPEPHLVRGHDPRAMERDFGRDFERWWFAEDQVAWFARELRNDAAHRVYEKAPDGPLWRMEIAGRTIALADFAERYSAHLGGLAELVERAGELALAALH